MEFVYAVKCLLNTYKTAKCITSLFIDQTADLMASIGKREFEQAINCLRDAKYSTREKAEVDRSITLLLSSIAKFSDKNKLKFQGLLLVALCYNALEDKFNTQKYQNLSIYAFKSWLDANSPTGTLRITSIPGFSAVRNHGLYLDFKLQVESVGLQWKGHPLIGELMTANWCFLRQEVECGVENAYEDYTKFVNKLF